jgi:hypothetical protein
VLEALLYLVPLVALAITLLARRYPGERVLIALCDAEPAAWTRSLAYVPTRGKVLLRVVRGGRLIACSLAVRPPPMSIATS